MKSNIASINREAIAQAALSFIIANNLAVQAQHGKAPDEYVSGMLSAVQAMQDEFLRWASNSTQEFTLTKLDGIQAIALAQLVYTCVTTRDTQVLTP